MFKQFRRIFRVGNRRLNRENANVLRVRLRTDELRRARTRFAAQVLTVLFSGAALLFIGWRGVDWAVKEFVTENPAFITKTIDLQTDGALTAEALRRWAGVHIGENLMRFDLTRIKRDLELVPLIQSVAVERALPDTLRIRVTERVPMAQVPVLRPRAGGGYTPVLQLLDATGHVMLPPDRTMVADPKSLQLDWLTELRGVNDVDLRLGRPVESTQVRAALKLLAHFERSGMFSRADIRRVDVSNAEVLIATTSTGSEITFAAHKDFDTQLRRWRAVLDVATQQGKVIATLDVSIAQNLPARWVEAASVPAAPAKPVKPTPYRRKNA